MEEDPVSRRLAIVILNYRTPGLTIACLASLASQVEVGHDVAVVVDNSSGDGSADRIEAVVAERGWQAWAHVLRSPVNRGFAGGNNLGIQSVDAETYLLLNSDTVVLPGALASLRTALQTRPEAGLIGPSMEIRPGQFTPSAFYSAHPGSEFFRAAGTGLLARLFRHQVCYGPARMPFEPAWIGFACVLIRRQVMAQIGLLDAGFFMYFEDIDYCRRARAAGWKILYWPEACIVHYVGCSSQVNVPEVATHRQPRYYYEARTRYFLKHYGRAGLFLANVLWVLGRGVSLAREWLGSKPKHTRVGEARDIWLGFSGSVPTDPPVRPASGQIAASAPPHIT